MQLVTLFTLLLMVCVGPVIGGLSSFFKKNKELLTDIHRDNVESAIDRELSMSFGYARDLSKNQQFIDNVLEKYAKYLGFRRGELERLERIANEKLMILKEVEYETGVTLSNKYLGLYDIFDILRDMKNSDLFNLIKSMPKFGYLHCHQTAMGTIDYLMRMPTRAYCGPHYDLIYLKHHKSNELDIRGFKVSRSVPDAPPDPFKYTRLKDVVYRLGDYNMDIGEEKFVQIFRPLLTLNKLVNAMSKPRFNKVKPAWDAFSNIFDVIGGLLNYAPFLEKHLEHGLAEMLNDNIQYVEIKVNLLSAYDLDNSRLSPNQTFDIYKRVCENFRLNPQNRAKGWIGAKLIYSPCKHHDNVNVPKEEIFLTYKQLLELDTKDRAVDWRRNDSGFLIGIDLTGHEESTSMSDFYLSYNKSFNQNTNYFYHTTESKFYSTVDDNLYDAVNMPVKRIGNGYSIVKHPFLMELAKKRDICFEACPISNDILKLSYDFRSHPIGVLLANNVPLVLSSDDPSYWEAYPLTHDFYITFVFISSYRHDMRILKKLITNSIRYSGLSKREKELALKSWFPKYVNWLHQINDKDVSAKQMQLERIKREKRDYFLQNEKEHPLTPVILSTAHFQEPNKQFSESQAMKNNGPDNNQIAGQPMNVNNNNNGYDMNMARPVNTPQNMGNNENFGNQNIWHSGM